MCERVRDAPVEAMNTFSTMNTRNLTNHNVRQPLFSPPIVVDAQSAVESALPGG
jgi:hypothetical protein